MLAFPGCRQSGSGLDLRLRVENRTERRKTFPGPWPKLRSYSPGEFGRNYLGANLVNSMLCRSAIGRASQLVRVPHLHHQNRKLILISREQKGLASCQFYQMPLYLLPLLGPRVSLGLENQFLSHSGIFSRPLEEKLQSRTKALPLLSQHPSLLQGIRTSGGGGAQNLPGAAHHPRSTGSSHAPPSRPSAHTGACPRPSSLWSAKQNTQRVSSGEAVPPTPGPEERDAS